ncbi:MAG TPA: hypothetical protein VGX92_10860 [Pyrinomonadaceae bacterium]|nr:hypothetical protein [Pyrinomonadaceae bacterium]
MKNLKHIISVFITIRRIVMVLLLITLMGLGLNIAAQAQHRRSTRASRTRTARHTLVNSRLTGTYRFDRARSEDARTAAERGTNDLPPGVRERVFDDVWARLASPDALAIERHGSNFSIVSSSAPRITFDANGQERSESVGDDNMMRARATVDGDILDVNTSVDGSSDFNVTFESLDNGRRLGVTRRIFNAQLDQPIIVKSFYNKSSNIAQGNIYGGPRSF